MPTFLASAVQKSPFPYSLPVKGIFSSHIFTHCAAAGSPTTHGCPAQITGGLYFPDGQQRPEWLDRVTGFDDLFAPEPWLKIIQTSLGLGIKRVISFKMKFGGTSKRPR